MRSARDASVQGFTLVEILVVVIILGIASAVIIPQMGTRDDLRVAAGARVVMSDLMYAQNRAIVTQRRHYLRFAGSAYTLYDDAAMTTPVTHPVNKTPYVVQFGAGGQSGLDRVDIGSASFDGAATLGFDELGSPFSVDGGGSEAPLLNAGSLRVFGGPFALTVSIEPYTGEISAN